MTGLSARTREAQERCRGDVRFRQWIVRDGAGYMHYVDMTEDNGFLATADAVVANMRITLYTDSGGAPIYEGDIVRFDALLHVCSDACAEYCDLGDDPETHVGYIAPDQWGTWWVHFDGYPDMALDEYVERESRILSHETVIGHVFADSELLEQGDGRLRREEGKKEHGNNV